MLRRILDYVISVTAKRRPSPSEKSSDVVLYAKVGKTRGGGKRSAGRPVPIPNAIPPQVRHREQIYSMRIDHCKICSLQRSRRLQEIGVVTAGDLSQCDPRQIAKHFGAPKKAARVLQQYRRAIRFAASVPGMTPRDAMLLISIHRRSVSGLAQETAASLHRDLERFAESTPGRRQLRGRRVPSTRRLKRWIESCSKFSATKRPPQPALPPTLDERPADLVPLNVQGC